MSQALRRNIGSCRNRAYRKNEFRGCYCDSTRTVSHVVHPRVVKTTREETEAFCQWLKIRLVNAELNQRQLLASPIYARLNSTLH